MVLVVANYVSCASVERPNSKLVDSKLKFRKKENTGNIHHEEFLHASC